MSDFESFGPRFGEASAGHGFSSVGWQSPRRWWSNVVTRAVRRALLGSLAIVPSVLALVVANNRPHGEDVTTCLVVAAGLGGVFILLCRWFGKGRGILWGLWLWLLSIGLTNGVACGVSIAVDLLAASHGKPIDGADLLLTAIIGGGLLLLCGRTLNRIDPDD